MYPQNNFNQLNIKNINRIFFWLFIVGFLCLLATFTIRGSFHFTPSANQVIYINDHKLTAETVKLRPATYTIKVTSARYQTSEEQIKITPFSTKSYTPQLTEREPSTIVSSAIGAFGYYGPPQVIDHKWFADDTWFTAQIGPNDITPIALHYVNGEWKVAYFANPGYPDDITVLPSSVAQYIEASLKQLQVNG